MLENNKNKHYYEYYNQIQKFIENNPFLGREISKEYFKNVPEEIEEYRYNQINIENFKFPKIKTKKGR